GHVLEHVVAVHRVERAVAKRQPPRVRARERGRLVACTGIDVEIDADDRGARLARDVRDLDTGAAPHHQHASRLHSRFCEQVAEESGLELETHGRGTSSSSSSKRCTASSDSVISYVLRASTKSSLWSATGSPSSSCGARTMRGSRIASAARAASSV